MPQVLLSPAESLLVTLIEDEVIQLEQQVRDLLDEIRQKRQLAGDLICQSHGDPSPPPSFEWVRDDKGRPTHLTWEKT